jgi:hypothetical protein
MSGARDIWDGKPVTFVEFSIRDGDWVGQGFDVSNTEGSYRLLSLAMRWAETGTRVFPDAEDIWALPYRHRVAISRLAAKAAYANGMLADDPDAIQPGDAIVADGAEVRLANGHDATEAAAPSP